MANELRDRLSLNAEQLVQSVGLARPESLEQEKAYLLLVCAHAGGLLSWDLQLSLPVNPPECPACHRGCCWTGATPLLDKLLILYSYTSRSIQKLKLVLVPGMLHKMLVSMCVGHVCSVTCLNPFTNMCEPHDSGSVIASADMCLI